MMYELFEWPFACVQDFIDNEFYFIVLLFSSVIRRIDINRYLEESNIIF